MALAIAVAGIGFSGCGSNASAEKKDNEAKITNTTIEGQMWDDSSEHYVFTFYKDEHFSIIAQTVHDGEQYNADGIYSLNSGTLTLTYKDKRKAIYRESSKNGKTIFVGEDTYILYLNNNDAQASLQTRQSKTSSQSSK